MDIVKIYKMCSIRFKRFNWSSYQNKKEKQNHVRANTTDSNVGGLRS